MITAGQCIFDDEKVETTRSSKMDGGTEVRKPRTLRVGFIYAGISVHLVLFKAHRI